MNDTFFSYNLTEYQGHLAARAAADLQLSHLREDLKARQVFLTPTGAEYKALGANDTDRENVMLKTFAADPICIELHARIINAETQQSAAAVAIAQAEAARRAGEWEITRLLASALAGYNGHGNPGQAGAQAAGLQAAQAAAEELTQANPTQDEPLYSIADIPF